MSVVPFPQPDHTTPVEEKGQGWLGITTAGDVRATRIARIAEIWRDQGLAVLPLHTTMDEIMSATLMTWAD